MLIDRTVFEFTAGSLIIFNGVINTPAIILAFKDLIGDNYDLFEPGASVRRNLTRTCFQKQDTALRRTSVYLG